MRIVAFVREFVRGRFICGILTGDFHTKGCRMAKQKAKKKTRTTSETILLVLSIIIALSMILGLIVGLGGGSRTATTTTSQLIPSGPALSRPVVTVQGQSAQVAILAEAQAPPGW